MYGVSLGCGGYLSNLTFQHKPRRVWDSQLWLGLVIEMRGGEIKMRQSFVIGSYEAAGTLSKTIDAGGDRLKNNGKTQRPHVV
jgi:hypothetical protein